MRIFPRRRRAIPAAPVGRGYSLLDSQLSIGGDLTTTGSLRVEGHLEGSIRGADSVVVGVDAVITGDIHAREVIVGGTITGDVHAAERLELQATAIVTGDVHTGSVLIQEGGVVNGRVLMSPPAAPAPRGRKQQTPAEPAAS
jgi:cytoskeletal protein CcmA (bactofilin family)